MEAVENREALEISETLEVMDASNACEAMQASARSVYKAFQEKLLQGFPNVFTRPPQGLHKAFTGRVQGVFQ